MRTVGVLLFVALTLGMTWAWADTELQQLAGLIEGRFDTHASKSDLPADQRLVDVRTRIRAPRLGDYVFYQQLNQRENLEVYRQRILILTLSGETVEQHAYALKEPEWYVDANAAVFETIGFDDLDAFMPEGCEQVWTKTADGYRGYVDPERCQIVSSRTGKPRQIESENFITADSLSLVERGYDAETGEQLFGSPQGESLRLGRVR